MNQNASLGDGVRQVLEEIGATGIVEQGPGEFDFRIREIGGFARERQGRVRISIFVAHDVVADEAHAWVRSMEPVSTQLAATVEVIESEDLTSIRLLMEVPFGEVDVLRWAGECAAALAHFWTGRHEPRPEIATALSELALVIPTPWRSMASQVVPYGNWTWGDGLVDRNEMYRFDPSVAVRYIETAGVRFALSHAGHGLNSYGLTLLTTSPCGSVAAFVQHTFGAVYLDPLVEVDAINATYARLHLLLSAADKDVKTPQDPVWMLVYSNLHADCSLIDLVSIREGASPEDATTRFNSESELFATTASRLGLKILNTGGAQDVAW